jgi:hypothetical protein
MTKAALKSKRVNSPPKYPGKLGRQRKLSTGLQTLFDWRAAGFGADPTIHIEGEDLQAWMKERGYISEGIDLLRQHFKITGTNPAEVMVALSWHLMRTHVPYFMPPVRSTGRPRKLATMFPLVHGLMKGREDGRVKMSADQIVDFFAEQLKVTPETVEREYRKWLKGRGGN